MHKQLIQE